MLTMNFLGDSGVFLGNMSSRLALRSMSIIALFALDALAACCFCTFGRSSVMVSIAVSNGRLRNSSVCKRRAPSTTRKINLPLVP